MLAAAKRPADFVMWYWRAVTGAVRLAALDRTSPFQNCRGERTDEAFTALRSAALQANGDRLHLWVPASQLD